MEAHATKNKDNEMFAAYCGFNTFGQFGKNSSERVNEFKELRINDFPFNKNTLMSPNWSSTGFAYARDFIVLGCFGEKLFDVIKIKTTHNIKQIAATDSIYIVLLDNGKFYKFDPEIHKELVELPFECVQPPISATSKEAMRVETIREFTHFEKTLYLAITNLNGFFVFPKKIQQFPRQFKIKQLVCGPEHALLLTTNGDVYSWGNGGRGQLGHEDKLKTEAPVLIEALAGIKITHIAVGTWHSAAISAFGDLYTWGFNSNGQLGKPVAKNLAENTTSVYILPELIDLPTCSKCSTNATTFDTANASEMSSDCVPVKVFAGSMHTIVLMSCGVLYAAGCNSYGQLGLEECNEICDEFKQIKFKTEFSVSLDNINIICGPWSTICTWYF